MKTPPWLLVPRGVIRDGAVVSLDAGEGRHATGPLRLRSGDEVVLADGAGMTANARLDVVGRSKVVAEVTSWEKEPHPAGDGVVLALAVIEAKAMDWAVQKAVEIGIRRFQPIVTERTQSGRRVARDRVSHWRRVALQALKQCRRAWEMDILDVQPLSELAATVRGAGVVADPDGAAMTTWGAAPGRVLAVGPEGGFSEAERATFEAHGWARLRLGSYTLRSETAAVVGGSMLVAWDEEA